MKKFNVTLQAEILVEFDENSEEFKELWANYKAHFDSNADYQTLAECIAQFIGRYGTQEMYEGIGFVKLNGENQNIFVDGKYEEQTAYVNIECDTDLNRMVDFEVYYTEDRSDENSDDGF